MSVANHEFVISLQEPALLVKDYMRRFHTHSGDELRRSEVIAKVTNYNTMTFMGLVAQAIFNTPVSHVGKTDKDLEQAEKLLIWDGMKPQVVVECVRRVFELTLDTIVSVIPDFAFYDETGLDFVMINEFDLRVNVPFK